MTENNIEELNTFTGRNIFYERMILFNISQMISLPVTIA